MQAIETTVKEESLSFVKVVNVIGFVLDVMFLVCLVILLFFPNFLINTLFKSKIESAVSRVMPGYVVSFDKLSYNILQNRIECNSLEVAKLDSSVSCSIRKVALSGTIWINLLNKDNLKFDAFIASVLNVDEASFTFHKMQYTLHFQQIFASVPDSVIILKGVRFHPLLKDEKFFAESKFSKTRVRMFLPRVIVTGLPGRKTMNNKVYETRYIEIRNPVANILVNIKENTSKQPDSDNKKSGNDKGSEDKNKGSTEKNKGADEKNKGSADNKNKTHHEEDTTPLMPNEIFFQMNKIIRIDSMKLINAKLIYSENHPNSFKPGALTFNNLGMIIRRVTNDRHAVADIKAEAKFLKTSKIKLHMSIPLMSPDFSLDYSGTLDSMDLRKVNEFIEGAEHLRIKSGQLEKADYTIHVKSGDATGHVKALYKNLFVEKISGESGSEDGIENKLATMLLNLIKLRSNNEPDKSGSVKIGEVKYKRNKEDTFLSFIWLALRSGIGNVVGF